MSSMANSLYEYIYDIKLLATLFISHYSTWWPLYSTWHSRLPNGLECGGFRFGISCFVWHCILAVDFAGGDNHNYIFLWFTVRINNHYSTSEGVVQIFYDGEWGSICGDGCVDAFVWWIKLRFHWDSCDKIVLLPTLHEIRHLFPNGLITQ